MRRAGLIAESARLAFVDQVRDANSRGYGYGRLAKALGLSKPGVQKLCNGSRGGGRAREPLIDAELEAWREAEWLRAHREI